MTISDLFNCICCSSCGLCCDSGKPLCETCEIHTLNANGLSESLAPEISGLSKTWRGNGDFEYSDLYNKLKELIEKRKQHLQSLREAKTIKN